MRNKYFKKCKKALAKHIVSYKPACTTFVREEFHYNYDNKISSYSCYCEQEIYKKLNNTQPIKLLCSYGRIEIDLILTKPDKKWIKLKFKRKIKEEKSCFTTINFHIKELIEIEKFCSELIAIVDVFR